MLCHVKTSDYRTYTITLWSGNIWSDWVPLSINDIYFTYHDIIYKNILELKQLESYKNLEVVLDWTQVRVTFTSATPDNTFFFTNYILPQHALVSPSLEYYKQSFAIEPVYNNCAKIMSQTKDQYSLIFDLSDCEDTKLWFYQIKNMQSFDNFKNSIQAGKQSMIDIYSYPETLPGYETKNLITNKLVTIFFNTNSENLRVRVRRALWWVIKYNFFNEEGNEYIQNYGDSLFNYFVSKGTNVKDFIESLNEVEEGMLSKKDLMDAWVKEIPEEIFLSWINQKFVFYSEKKADDLSLTMKFNEKYDKIAIKYGDNEEKNSTNYNKDKKSLNYSIATKDKTYWSWLNKYTIYATVKDKKEAIWSVDIYNLYVDTSVEVPKKILKILYYDNPISKEVVKGLKKTFKEKEIEDYFTFEEITDTQKREEILLAGSYDMVINTIDMWIKEDLTKLFSTNKATINPSQYNDWRFVSLLRQHVDAKDNTTIIREINNIYSNDMPFVILGKEYSKIHIRSDLVPKLMWSGDVRYEYNRRNNVYKNLSLTFNVHIDPEKARNFSNFINFIQTTLKK